jgi:hypothetical protein
MMRHRPAAGWLAAGAGLATVATLVLTVPDPAPANAVASGRVEPVVRSAGGRAEPAGNPRRDQSWQQANAPPAAALSARPGGAGLDGDRRAVDWLRAATEALHVKYVSWPNHC